MYKSDLSVAVLLSTHNRAHLIGEAIDSLLGQTRPPDQLHIIDDGSTDDTQRVVAGYGGRVSLTVQTNAGRAAAFNRVIPAIDADYIWLFDDDDIALPHALDTHLELLRTHPQYDFTYSPHYFFERRAQLDEPNNLAASRAPALDAGQFLLWLMSSHFAPTQLQGMLIPTACFEAVGPFDDKLLRSQDIDMMLRLARRFRAGRIAQPTWALRQHTGVRGAGDDSHDADDRFRIWRHYKHRVFTRLRNTLTLAEYLPEQWPAKTPDSVLVPLDYRRALLQRAVIMSIHGLHAQAADDWSRFCDDLKRTDRALSAVERQKISQLSHIHNPETAPAAVFFYRLGRAARGDRRLLKLMLRGLYWSAVRDLRACNVVGLGQILRSATALSTGFVMPGPGAPARSSAGSRD